MNGTIATNKAGFLAPGGVRRMAGAGEAPRLKEEAALPRVSPWMTRWFTGYTTRYLRRHFHSLGISKSGLAPVTGSAPVVLFLNHASWWDPLVCIELKRQFFRDRTGYAPIDAAMLKRYPFFRRLGFFGVEQRHRRGAVEFLRMAEESLRASDTLLVITPQGRFADVRERPVSFASGLGHLAARIMGPAVFVPLAIEYVFWTERLPEILVRFGEPIRMARGAQDWSAHEWNTFLEQRLEATQDALACEVQRRDPECFSRLLEGKTGTTAIYDGWRTVRPFLRGQKFTKEHSA